jgi:hypothetical protein
MFGIPCIPLHPVQNELIRLDEIKVILRYRIPRGTKGYKHEIPILMLSNGDFISPVPANEFMGEGKKKRTFRHFNLFESVL